MEKCSSEKQAEKLEYYTKKEGNYTGPLYAENSYCLDMAGLYLAGEPISIVEASLVIGFERHPDIILDPILFCPKVILGTFVRLLFA